MKALRSFSVLFLLLAASRTRAEDAAGVAVDFAREVWPIFQSRCIECHGEKKGKAGLRLHSASTALKGGKSGKAIVAGDSAASLLVERISLPEDHDDLMPAEGGPLTQDQIALIRRWIDQGAVWPGGPAPEAAAAELKGVPVTPAEEAAVAKLREKGVLVVRIAQDVEWLAISFFSLGENAGDAEVALLKDIANLKELNLAGTAVTGAGLVAIAGLEHLSRLHLERTKISDGGLRHLSGLKNLEYLNLYSTQVSDAGLEHLRGLRGLKNLYLWQAKVTEEGAARLREAIPGLYVNTGVELVAAPKEPEPETVPEPPPEKPAEKPAARILLAASSGGWRYAPASEVQGDEWVKPEYDAGKWAEGKTPLGYGEAIIAERQGTTLDITGRTVLLRRLIDVDEKVLAGAKKLRLLVASDNSAIVWIDGKEVDRDTGNHEAQYWNRTVELPPGALHAGRNTVAVQVNNNQGSSDLVIDVQIEALGE